MNEAMLEVHGNERAIDLIKWTDSWLKRQGPNTLIVEAVVKGAAAATPTLNIRQGFANEYADQIYREQRVDVLIYASSDSTAQKPLLLTDVHVRPQELT